MSDPPPTTGQDLPPELLAAADLLLATPEAARERVLADLLERHREHAAALRVLAADLFAMDRLLADGYREPRKATAGAADAEPTEIGSYRVLRRLGEGSFGAVYLCQQLAPVRRDVAIKVLRPGAGNRQTLARFEAEQQFLARQNHPAITQVFDAGTLTDGRPYFVMEHVAGQPITAYCDERNLSIRARVELFESLCHGVEHAHAHGIVHRDLKPANVLVVDIDGKAQPKVIDFGIAKAIDPATDSAPAADGPPTPDLTETGRVVGTPGYMSPEQALGQRHTIDARSDVFTLGVMLYELLAGELPWGRLPTSLDTEPLLPSQRVAKDPSRAGTVSSLRSCDPSQLRTHLRGDLDWIVLKALHRQRDARYASARGLADDLRRHLHDERVLAGPPSLGYRLRKAIRRRRAAVMVLGACLLALAAALWVHADYRDDLAAREGDTNAAVANLLTRANDPAIVGLPNAAPLRQALLQDALAFYRRFLHDRPDDPRHREGRARTLCSLSEVHHLLGQNDAAVATAREAVDDAESLLAATPHAIELAGLAGAAWRRLGRARMPTGDMIGALDAMVRSAAALRRCAEAEPREYATQFAASLLDQVWLERRTGSTPIATDAVDRARQLLENVLEQEPDAENTRSALIDTNLGLLELFARADDDAGGAATLRRLEALLPDVEHAGPERATKLHRGAAHILLSRGDHESALRRLQQAIASSRLWHQREQSLRAPLDHLAHLHRVLATTSYVLGRYADGDASLRTAIECAEQQLTRFPDDYAAKAQLVTNTTKLAKALATRGRRSHLVAAEAAARRALQILASMQEPNDQVLREYMEPEVRFHLAVILSASGRPEDAAEALQLRQAVGDGLVGWRDRFVVSDSNAAHVVAAGLWLAERHHRDGADDPAAAFLGIAEVALRDYPTIEEHARWTAEACRLGALLARGRGDAGAAIAAAERALAAGAGWCGTLAAADAMYAAAATSRTADHRRRAAQLFAAAIGELEPLGAGPAADVTLSVPLAEARIRLAELLVADGRPAEGKALLPPAIAALEAARADSFADRFDERLLAAAQAMIER